MPVSNPTEITNMLRTYPEKNLYEKLAIFNYRLSRAKPKIKNSFGILRCL